MPWCIEPELIILDEPTLGLDPNQMRTVRQLIKDLAQHHTVLISTHILPEVEVTCHARVNFARRQNPGGGHGGQSALSNGQERPSGGRNRRARRGTARVLG